MRLIRAQSKILSRALQQPGQNVVGEATAPAARILNLQTMSRRGTKRATLEEQGIVGHDTVLPGGFLVESIEYVKEFDVTLVQMRHTKTGAYFLHVDTEDTNNAFGVTFRTPAKESTGVAHILEHVVLCGSEKYPVRDPFFKMLKRSMNTYMNAMTAQDYTSYPFSTVVEQDYHNLMGVYLDATFFPLLKETDFLQEGHRLELGDSGGVKRTGVVYNEMKGHLSDSSSLFSAKLQEDLFGDSVFGHISGGDWKRIPSLSYQRLVDFHRSHYHPSNALFVSYGDLPITKTLERIDQLVLTRFKYDETFAKEPLSQITQTQIVPNQKQVEMVIPADGEQDTKLKLARAWVLNEFNGNDPFKSLAGRILSSLLLDGPQAPVYQSLIDAQIAPSFAPTTGFDVSSLTPTFSIGAQGVTDVQKAEDAITAGLERAAKEGFSQDRVSAVIHQLELSVRHKKANFGLMCLYAASGAWAHGGPTSLGRSFRVTKLIDELKERSSPEFWRSLAERWALRGWKDFNVRLVAHPSPLRSKEDLEWEQAELAKIQLSDEEKKAIQEKSVLLAKERETPEDISVLPTLDVTKDVPLIAPEAVRVMTKSGKQSSKEIQQVLEQRTNGVTYLRTFFDFTEPFAKSEELTSLKPLLPVMCSMLGAVDAGERNYKDLDLALERTAGTLGISPSMPVWLGVEYHPNQRYKQGDMAEGVLVTLDCLTPNAPAAYEGVLADVLTRSNFATDDGRRLQALLATSAQSLKTSMTSDASRYARKICRAPLSPGFALEELYSGFSHVKMVMKASESGLEGAQKLSRALKALSLAVFSPTSSTSKASFVDVGGESLEIVDRFLARVDALAKQSAVPTTDDLRRHLDELTHLDLVERMPLASHATYLSLPVPVHYCSAAIKTNVNYGHVDDAAMSVLAQLASYDYLHQHVREKGGAYGAGAGFDSHGVFSLSSFWDPNSVKTLETFDDSLKWLCDAKFTEKQVDEALLSIFGSMDAPQSPSSKGMSFFLQGITPEMRDAQREKYFDLVGKSGIAKLREVAQRHLSKVNAFKTPSASSHPRTSVCVAGKQDSAEIFAKMEGWTTLSA